MGNQKRTKSKYKLSFAEQKKCNSIIHTASLAAGAVGGGVAQVPLADNIVITPLQVGMIISLGKVFNQNVTESAAKGLLGGIIASFIGRGISQVVWGWVPVIGNVSNAITAVAITETIGWISVDHFYKERYLKGNAHDEGVNYSKSSVNEEAKKDFREELKERASEFIDRNKNRIENTEELMSLLDEFEAVLIDLPETDELYGILKKLLKLK